MRLLSSCLLACAALSTQAAVLLEINITDPSAVIITATGNYAESENSSFTVNDGISLLMFFTGEGAEGPLAVASILGSKDSAESTLVAAGASNPYIYWMADNVSDSETAFDLNLYGDNGEEEPSMFSLIVSPAGNYQFFRTSTAAFSGTGIFDLSSNLVYLPSVGTSGQIVPGYSESGTGPSIGQWLVIPEPSTYALLVGIAGLGFAAVRRFRR